MQNAHNIASKCRTCSRARARVYVYIVTYPVFLGVCLFAYLYICTSVHQRAQNEQIFPPVCAPANQHFCPPAGTNGHVRRPRAQNCAIFFARRNALAFSALRPFQEKFPKISPKFLRQKFGVCAKSPYLCTRKTEMRPTTPHKSEAIRSLKTLHKTIL